MIKFLQDFKPLQRRKILATIQENLGASAKPATISEKQGSIFTLMFNRRS